MTHLTAGDILPLNVYPETVYGQPIYTASYYADVKGDGGNFTPTDTPNPYVAWKSGKRTYYEGDYLPTNYESGYSAVLETIDRSGWEQIITNAIGGTTTSGGVTVPAVLPSRSIVAAVTTRPASGINPIDSLMYCGCKTDKLEVKADQPGGIVEFNESVMAAFCTYGHSFTSTSAGATSPIQWVGGVEINHTPIYPQNFRLSINNNLGRVKGIVANNSNKPGTVGLVEGRQEIELSMDVWMEDLVAIKESGPDFGGYNNPVKTIELTLGINNPQILTARGYPMADGQHPGLIQDKQMQTLRFRIYDLAIAAPESS